MARKVTVICQNDFPHSVYLDEERAVIEANRWNIEDIERQKQEGGKRIYYHLKTVDFIS